jgi:lauroyl/myristoyl acyltransferase
MINKVNTRQSDFKYGVFNGDNLSNHSDFLLELRNCDIEDVKKIITTIQQNEIKNNKEKWLNFERFILNNIYRTDLYDKGFDVKRIARDNTLLNCSRNAILAFTYIFINNKKFQEKYIKYQGLESIKSHLEKENGIVNALYHWDLFQITAAIYLETFKNPISIIAAEQTLNYVKTHTNLYQNEHVSRIHFLPADENVINKGIKKLKENNIVILLPELSGIGHYSKISKRRNFLGTEVITPEGTAALSAYGNAPIFASMIHYEGNYKINCKFELIANETKRNREDINKNTNAVWDHLEKIVLEDPSHWCGWEIFDRIQNGF